MPGSRLGLLRWQFDLTWSLFELHLSALRPADHLWEPAPRVWTVRRDPDGSWVPDWADTEPDPLPAPTIAWLTWHIGWWWSVATDHLRGRAPRERADVRWPGPDEAVAWLRGMSSEWVAALNDCTETTLDAPATFPWRDNPERTVGHLLAWVNAELMKNAAEIGQLRILRCASA
ncbi:DinB family protein [Nocardia arthritidis]|uniref:DinB family protein n=1 Tax=Nocardia arthritidis TaxID=228602 RepID=A0A6G9YFI3_9NOCA|nr:DinB family protein [Nocardia arthritidis]QIS12045.1 DinB family protein [Nocardia arthritidis]